MSLFDRMFRTKGAGQKKAAGPRGDDFVTALSIHLCGDPDRALGAYLAIAEEVPGDCVAPFFAAAIQAGKGNVAEAAAKLRFLSQRIASGGEIISSAIRLELIALVADKPVIIKIAAVAELVASFGELLKKEGFIRESAVCLEIAAGLVPDHADVLHKLGDVLHDLRNYEYAESVLQEALKFEPSHWGALYTYAVLLQDLGRDEEAIGYYEKAVQFNPGHVNCQNNYGAALLRTNRLEEALAHCTLAAGLDPGSAFVKVNLGNIYLLMQEYESARTCFAEAVSLNDRLAPAYFGLGSAEQALQGDPERVQELYLKAIQINPSIPEIHQALGNLLAGAGNPEALAHFSAAARLNNNMKNLHRDFGTACLKLGNREEGLEHLRMALQQDPDDVALQGMLAEAQAQ